MSLWQKFCEEIIGDPFMLGCIGAIFIVMLAMFDLTEVWHRRR